MYDLILKNGTIVDGLGGEPFVADLAIKDGKIAAIAPSFADGKEILDVTGLTVTPGFIDSHSHSDNLALEFPDQIEKIEQGITVSVGGQCGSTKSPWQKGIPSVPVADFGMSSDVYKTMGNFLNTAKEIPLGASLATFVGHGALRGAVLGGDDREPTPEELEQMAELLREGMKAGALGISFGLIYFPGCFAKTDELIYLAKTAAECGGMVSAHIRDEGDGLLEACEEFLQVVRASGAKTVFSHHKAMGKKNWGKVKDSLAMIDQAVAEGLDVYCDVYPYVASHTRLSSRFIPKKYLAGGFEELTKKLSDTSVRAEITAWCKEKYGEDEDFSWVLLTHCPAIKEYEGKCIPDLAKIRGKSVYDTVFDIIVACKNDCSCCNFMMCEEDLETVLRHPRSMICTDSSVRGNSAVYHPRLRGSFPRVLGKYVRERKVTSLPEMIRKMTSLPAKVYGFETKGVLREGMDADICVFDAEAIRDRADFDSCHERCEGLRYVLIDGAVVVKDAVYQGTRKGKMLV